MQLRNITTALSLLTALFAGSAAQAQTQVSEIPAGIQEPDAPDNQDPYSDIPVMEHSHGFRMGYGLIANVKANETLTTPSLFVLGYEVNQRLIGGEAVDIIFAEVLAVSGMNQGLFIPTGNFLIGAEFNQTLRASAGMHVSPLSTTGDLVHMIASIGYSVDAGRFNLPIDIAWIPDTDPKRNHWRGFATVGVNW